MSSKIGLNLIKNYSINFNPNKRKPKYIKFIILHYTGMKKKIKLFKNYVIINQKSVHIILLKIVEKF